MQCLVFAVALFSGLACVRSQPQKDFDLIKVMCGDDNPSCAAMVTKFSQWKKRHGKEYTHDAHHQKAFSNFQQTEKRIKTHNEQGHSWTMGHNAFSDLTPEEFEIMFGHPLPKRRELNPAELKQVPKAKSVDWVKRGAVTPVQNQGLCSSCVSFSAAGAIEGHYQIATGNLTSLSVQEIVDCNTPAFGGQGEGCQGGFIDQTFTFVSNFEGLCAAQDYPYTGTQGKCRGTEGVGPSCTPVAAVKGFLDVTSETDLLKAVSLGPVSAGIDAGNNVFHNYKSGVIDSAGCGTDLDHAILIVGFGTDEATGLDYWKIKNSWGTSWGEDGYARLVRGKNMCGIASYPPSYPTGVGPAKVRASSPPQRVAKGATADPQSSSQSGSQYTVKDACKDSPPKQRAACLAQLSRDLASEALKLGFPVPAPRRLTVVTPSGEAVHVPQHELGCGFLDFHCHLNVGKCELCKRAVPSLRDIDYTKCVARCPTVVEQVGMGPEDPIADAVTASCPSICSEETQTDVGWWTAEKICSTAGLC